MIPPPAPEFGAPCPIQPSPEVLAFLATRRSASAQFLTAPGPDPDALAGLLRVAARVPDHGKLAPWRFVVLEGEAKARFVAGLRDLARGMEAPDRAEAALGKIAAPPLSVAVISHAQEGKIPLWEQELSAGAVCMSLLIAAQAMGFGANWITDWYAETPDALALLGVRPGERVAGFLHIGTVGQPPQERVRPDMDAIVTRWG